MRSKPFFSSIIIRRDLGPPFLSPSYGTEVYDVYLYVRSYSMESIEIDEQPCIILSGYILRIDKLLIPYMKKKNMCAIFFSRETFFEWIGIGEKGSFPRSTDFFKAQIKKT